MLTIERYRKEWELMRNAFPEFTAYAIPPRFGWQGYLKGDRTGRHYEVVLEADESDYPGSRPSVFINPRFGGNWLANGALCIADYWDAGYHTFANTVLRVIEYMEKNGA